MHSLGDQLLFIISAKMELPWHIFSSVLAKCIAEKRKKVPNLPPEKLRYVRYRTARAMSSLGYCDMDYSDGLKIIASPPVIIRLPILGIPKFQIIGSRSPAQMTKLPSIQKNFRNHLQIQIVPMDEEIFIPSRVELEVSEPSIINAVGEELGITFQSYPGAFYGLWLSGALQDYRLSLQWQEGNPESSTENFFDIEKLSFVRSIDNSQSIRLARWIDYVRQRRHYYLFNSGKYTRVDPDWGRYLALSAGNKKILYFDSKRNLFAVPSLTPLPRPIERAVTLCSGTLPLIVPREKLLLSNYNQCDFLVYKAISASFAEKVAEKLEQDLQKASLIF